MSEEFARGLSFWWRGWRLLWQSRTLGVYAIFPLVLAVGFFTGVMWLAVSHLHVWTNQFIIQVFPASEIWSSLLYYPMWLTLFILAFLVLVYLSYIVHVLLCGPFYSLLASKALQDLGKHSPGKFEFSFRIIVASVLKALVFCFLGIGILLFSFVPLINVVGLVLTLMILAFDTMDYSFDAMGMGFRARIFYFFNHFPQWFGMALSLALTLLVPGLTLLILPGAVVGAAMIFDSKSPYSKM